MTEHEPKPTVYRRRADELRQTARLVLDQTMRERLLRVAAEWDRLAKLSEKADLNIIK